MIFVKTYTHIYKIFSDVSLFFNKTQLIKLTVLFALIENIRKLFICVKLFIIKKKLKLANEFHFKKLIKEIIFNETRLNTLTFFQKKIINKQPIHLIY